MTAIFAYVFYYYLNCNWKKTYLIVLYGFVEKYGIHFFIYFSPGFSATSPWICLAPKMLTIAIHVCIKILDQRSHCHAKLNLFSFLWDGTKFEIIENRNTVLNKAFSSHLTWKAVIVIAYWQCFLILKILGHKNDLFPTNKMNYRDA